LPKPSVYNSLKEVMSYSYRQGNEYVFRNIPIGMKIKVIGLYKNEKQKQYYLAAKMGVIHTGKMCQLPLKKGSKQDVKNRIASLLLRGRAIPVF